MVRAVVDTNIFVSRLISRRGSPHQLREALRAGAFVLISSGDLVRELQRVLNRPALRTRYSIADADVDDLLELVRRHSVLVTPSEPLPITSRDSKDDKFLAAAFGGNVDYLVTGDEDLLALRDHPALGTLKIVTVSEFLALLREEETGP